VEIFWGARGSLPESESKGVARMGALTSREGVPRLPKYFLNLRRKKMPDPEEGSGAEEREKVNIRLP
jgi:hypothetical protein